MNTKKLLLAFVMLATAATGAFAQQNAEPASGASAKVDNSGGLLGKRYYDLGFSYVDVNHSRTDVYAASTSVNVPVAPSIDVGVGYSYAWAVANTGIHANDIDAYATYYFTAGSIKPFASASLGYAWATNGFSDRTIWGGQAGAEWVADAQWSVRLSGAYNSDFKRGNNGANWSGTLSTHYWFTEQLGGTVALSWLEHGDIGYSAGVAFRF